MNLFKNKPYLNFIIYFVFYGAIIAFFTSIINYNIQYSDIQKNITKDAKYASQEKINNIKNFISDIKQNIYATANNPTFLSYLQQDTITNKTAAQNLLLNTAMSHKSFFQVRFIDEKGKEVIRIDKDRATNSSFIVGEHELQDKSNRYYFKEAIQRAQGMYWRSNIDLNVEHHKIEKPIRPTMRIASSIYYNNKLHGILIINIDLSSLLKHIKENSKFDVYIVDSDGYFLVHPNEKYAWSKYLKTNYKLEDEFTNKHKNMLASSQYASILLNSFSLEDAFENNENLLLVLKTHDAYIHNLENNNFMLTIYLAAIILLVSIPLGIVLSLTPAKLQAKLSELLRKNNEQLDIIDKHILLSRADLDGNIIEVSTAMSNLSGYKKEDLLGSKMSIFKGEHMTNEIYETLWRTIKNGLVWHGELENKTKQNRPYWLDVTIIPHYNNENMIDNFLAISSDITDKKMIEYISEHDKLTQLYNRTKLDDVLENEYLRACRYNNKFSVILIDLDFFKSVNDNFGHIVGDSVLIEVAKILKNNVRKTDTLGRWGGEEFLIVCAETELKGARELAENIRVKIDQHDFSKVGNKTASIGVAEFKDTDDIKTLLKRCDDRLYEAKDSGRNCVK